METKTYVSEVDKGRIILIVNNKMEEKEIQEEEVRTDAPSEQPFEKEISKEEVEQVLGEEPDTPKE